MTEKTNRRIAIIDANVLMGGGTSCFHELKDTDIVIPAMVLGVLESHMSEDSYACSAVIRYIEKLRKQDADKLTGDGIAIVNGNTVRVRWTDVNVAEGHSRQFISAAEAICNKDQLDRGAVTVISNSANVRLMANHKGIKAEAYQGAALLFNGEFNFYREMSDADILRKIAQECADAGISTPHNAVIKFVASNGDEYGVKLKKGDQLAELPHSVHAGNLRPKNATQAIAMAYAMDTQITAVMFAGTAGAGKSMIALAAAINQVDAGLYDQIIVFRSMVEVEGQKLGFLPGSVDEKMGPWAQAVWDNVKQIDKINGVIKAQEGADGKSAKSAPGGKVQTSKGFADDKNTKSAPTGYSPQTQHPISVQPVSYVRGRTFNRTIVIVDDAQSLERSTLLSLLTRLGKNSKIIITGDMTQNDNHRISVGTSMLSLANDLAGRSDFAMVNFVESQRAPIAQFAADLMVADR